METLVNRLFAFAKMDVSQYPVHLEPLALRSELEAVAEEQADLAVTVDVPDIVVQADRELLRRIAVNLRLSPLPTTAWVCRRSSCPGCLMYSTGATPPAQRPAMAAASALRW